MKNIIYLLSLITVSCIAACEPDGGGETTDNLPRLSISSVTNFEGDDATVFTFKVSVSEAATEEIQVDYTTVDATAGVDIDYEEARGTLNIAAGVREAFIDVDIVTDIYKENDEEFKLVLYNPVNATISTAEGIGTIRNDDDTVFTSEDGYVTPDSYPGYSLVWQDEFDSEGAINSSFWTNEIGNSGWGNNELQYYTEGTNNAFQTGGNLIIEAREEGFNGAPYTSARLVTLNKYSFTHGRVDIRAKLPEGQGIWPALWMLGSNFQSIGWPACGEIDIMELVGHQASRVHGTAHWGNQGQGYSIYQTGTYNNPTGDNFSEEFHVFSLIWEPGVMRWYVDDNLYHTITNADVNGNYPFDLDFFFIFNIAVGGNWPGYPDETTQFPQRMYVDYIRVFQ